MNCQTLGENSSKIFLLPAPNSFFLQKKVNSARKKRMGSFMCLDVHQFVNVVGCLVGCLFCLLLFIMGIGMAIWCGPKGCYFEDKETKENGILLI